MANFLYDHFLTAAGKALVDVTDGNVKAVLVRIGAGHYVASQSADEFFTAINSTVTVSGDVFAISSALSTVTFASGGQFKADNVTWATVASSANQAGAVVLIHDTGTASTTRLIGYIDTYLGLPITPNGLDIRLVWPTGTYIFSLKGS